MQKNPFKVDIWNIRLDQLPKFKALWIRILRMVVLVASGFTKSQIQMGASALTYYTLLCIVPIVALLIGLAQGFNLESYFQDWLNTQFQDQREIISRLVEFAKASLAQAKGGIIALVGVAILLWSGIKILLHIENVMNQIWEVKVKRSLARRFSDYLAMIFICPIIILVASGLTVYLSASIATLQKDGVILKELSPILLWLLSLFPFVLTWILFTFLYIFMPNTRVKFLSAMSAGFVTTLAYEVVQWLYLYFQIGVGRAGAVYGTFAALPLFLVWVHLSWVLVLLGAKLAFALQNSNAYAYVTEAVKLSQLSRQLSQLRIAHCCVQRFVQGEKPLGSIEISNELAIPHVLTHELIFKMVEAGILIEVKLPKESDLCFSPAIDVENLTIWHTIEKLDQHGGSLPLPETQEVQKLADALEEFGHLAAKSKANVALKSI